MTTPLPRLTPGSIIDVVAPSSGMPGPMEDWSARIEAFGKATGFQMRMREGWLQGDGHFCAAPYAFRLAHFKEALHATDSDAIWVMRGGYGASQLLPALLEDSCPARAKWLIGFSDVTLLHLYVNQYLGWPSLHAPILKECLTSEIKRDAVVKLITGAMTEQHFFITPMNDAARVSDILPLSQLYGGNMCLIEGTIGTPWQPDYKSAIVLFEDVSEAGYRIDRSFRHLEDARLFDGVRAVLLGDFTHNTVEEYERITWALKDFAARQSFPVLQIQHIGHGETNHPILLGHEATLTLGEDASLHIALPIEPEF